jgi:hypothetical protein
VLGRLTGVLVPEAQTFRALVLFRAVHEVCFAKIGDSRDDDNAKGLLSPGPNGVGPGERVLPGCIIGREYPSSVSAAVPILPSWQNRKQRKRFSEIGFPPLRTSTELNYASRFSKNVVTNKKERVLNRL